MIPVTLNPEDRQTEVGVYGGDYEDGLPETVTLYMAGWEFSLSRLEANRLAEAIDSTLKGWAE